VQAPADVSKFSLFDMEYFFLQLKAKSIGEITNLNYTCKNVIDDKECGAPIKVDYNVLNTKVITNPEHTKKIELSGGVGIVMKYPAAGDKNLLGGTENAATQAIDLIARCVDYIWDPEKLYYAKDATKEELVNFLEALPDNDFKKIEQFFDTMPYIEDTLEFDCPKCKFHHKVVLEGLTSFFD
jgi:hypothetical protein